MTALSLIRESHRGRPALTALDEIVLPLARVHELCGPARHMLALVIAGATAGPILWIAPSSASAQLYPDTVAGRIAPGRLIFVRPRRSEDLLWAMEEALRSGAVPLVVTEVPEPPPLTPVRRLHLAAEAGSQAGRCAPLGLVLTPGEGGTAGVETRWHMAPRHAPGRTGWHLECRRARMAPPRAWRLSAHDGRLALAPATPDGA